MNFNGTFTQVIHELVQQVLPSLVIVRGHRFGAGAGIVWDANGLILTNNHVVGRHLLSLFYRMTASTNRDSSLVTLMWIWHYSPSTPRI